MTFSGFVAGKLESDPATAEDVAQIRRAAGRAAELTHQLLVLGRRDVVRPQTLDLNRVVLDAEPLVRSLMGEQIELKLDLEPDLHRVQADLAQVEQVLLNLVLNSRAAMPGRGTLRISTTNAKAAGERAGLPSGDYARLVVADDGVGMNAEVVEQAFEPFFTTRPKGEGTGLGLATAYSIVQQAGGEVELESVPGAGTVARVCLPATSDELPSTGSEPPSAAPGKGETVLVVEDEEAVREAVSRILSQRGYMVLEANGGEEALTTFEERGEEVELLVTDVVMPRISGVELAGPTPRDSSGSQSALHVGLRRPAG